MKSPVLAAITAFLLLLPAAGQAQGIIKGGEYGARQGSRAAGPIGGIVGGAVGMGLGGAAGVFGLDYRPRGAEGRRYYRARNGRYYRRR